MNKQRDNILLSIDWILVLVYILLILMGWLNIYAAVYDETHQSIFDITMRYGKQLMWMGAALIIAAVVLIIDSKFYSAFAYVIFGITITSLVAVLLVGTVSHGARSWFEIGNMRIQPSEFAKMATALALAQLLSVQGFSFGVRKDFFKAIAIVLLPTVLIVLQHDAGSAVVYSAFVFVLYREGMNSTWLFVFFSMIVLFVLALVINKLILLAVLCLLAILIYRFSLRKSRNALIGLAISILLAAIGFAMYYLFPDKIPPIYIATIAASVLSITALIVAWRKRWSQLAIVSAIFLGAVMYIISVDYVYNNVLEDHQQTRIGELLGIHSDPLGAGYNVNQSKIAIGSGGVLGKGFLQGTQTKYNFVPEQDTDFIFCTVGEEWGFVGSVVVLLLFVFLIIRIIILAERQRSSFSRIYGYGVASIFFFHVIINIGMTLGLAPVIGIPLPFFSYGGSSLWAFTILLFIFLRLDANRLEIFR